MKAKFSYELLPKAILRTPHYPEAFLYSLFDVGKVDCMLVSDDFLSMVQIAAPGLYKEVRRQLCNSGIILDKTRVALFKYMERACTRCTPFGAFASLSVVPVGQPYSGVRLRMSIENLLSLDYQFLDAIAHKANRDRIKYYANDTFYGHGKDMRFLVMGSGLIVKTVRMSQMVNFILGKCRSGLTVAEVVAALTGEFDVDSDCVIELVHNMIKEGLLLPESYPRVISRDETKRIIGIVSKDCTQLNEISRIIDDYKRITDPTNQIKIVDEIWDKCCKVANVKEKNILKLDTFRQIANGTGLNIRCFENILPALEVMARLCNNGVNEALKTFKSRFYNKYEGQEVKLLEALDPEIGIGYSGERMIKAANGLIDGITIPRPREPNRRVIAVNSRTTLLHDKLMASIAGDYATVIINDADVRELPSCIGNMPVSIAAMGQFVRVNDEACISGLHFCGPSAANLLGRFSENASIKSVVDQICAHEQSHSDDVSFPERG